MELLRALAGCFGLLMSVPLTSMTAAIFSSKGNMGTFRLTDIKIFSVLSQLGGRFSRAWKRAIDEAKKDAEEKQSSDGESQENLFEKARRHYDEIHSDESDGENADKQ